MPTLAATVTLATTVSELSPVSRRVDAEEPDGAEQEDDHTGESASVIDLTDG